MNLNNLNRIRINIKEIWYNMCVSEREVELGNISQSCSKRYNWFVLTENKKWKKIFFKEMNCEVFMMFYKYWTMNDDLYSFTPIPNMSSYIFQNKITKRRSKCLCHGKNYNPFFLSQDNAVTISENLSETFRNYIQLFFYTVFLTFRIFWNAFNKIVYFWKTA